MKRNRKIKVKEPIRLRCKTLKDGNKSLYLDFYDGGKREYQFLKLYLVPEKTAIDKDTNKQTLLLADKIKANKIVEYNNGIYGFSNSGNNSKINLIDYVNRYAEKKKSNAGGADRGTHQTYFALAYHLKQYAGDKTTFRHLNKSFCNGFLDYLRITKNTQNNKPLAENTQFGYMKKLETIINTAISDEVISANPFKQIKSNKPKKIDTEVGYLTVEEVQKLVNTECAYPHIKNAFLFSCLSGLRFSDVKSLSFDKLTKDDKGDTLLTYMQKKTKKQEYLPISDAALKYLPTKEITTNNNDLVFHLPGGGYVNTVLKTWVTAAGITKKVTFHVARHTAATILLSQDVALKTVSEMLGHSDIKVTQIYAKVIDKTKKAAANKFNNLGI